ncbi:phosphatidylserine/phosphatidylglycerophosphate/cardiolipin synthase family protein [uncultured Sphingomonas sp.]|uniref:phospholipase D-like domain-containing protein n=1 Tax=uncultured Sphingomonas sp. TaxID=158754 RepID=UPI0025869960|nr:phosphatidylserine/phosphatidylglycerophosphate/cardiolipin synthase family protein [uncultured Sphingomonas sp.]
MEDPTAQPTFAVDSNRLTLLDTGPRRLDALLALIDGARRSLRILYYIYADDESGRRVNAALAAAARRGVTVALIVDGFGSAADEAFFAPVEAAGVSVCRFAPRPGRRYLLRNHQKLALADAEEPGTARIIIGGFNIEDDYFGTPADRAWRDLGLLVEGAAAARIAGYFDALEDGIRHGGRIRRLNRALARWSETRGALRWTIGGPTRRLSPWARAIRDDMKRATRIDVIAGYFTPSPTMLRRLDRAGKRAATVRVVTAAMSDNNVTIAAARFTYAGLLKRGVRVFEYAPTKLHTKLYVVDDAVWVGSANFDMRSLFINLELMLRIEDRAFADHVRSYVDAEIARSNEVTPEAYKAATGWWQRAKQFVAYLLTAVADPAISRGLNWGIDAEE